MSDLLSNNKHFKKIFELRRTNWDKSYRPSSPVRLHIAKHRHVTHDRKFYSPLTTPGCDLCIPVQSMGPLSSVTKSIKENVNKNEGRLSHLLHKCTFCLNKPFRVLVLWIIVIRVANALFNTKLKNFAVVVLKSRRRMCMESSGLILI